MQISICKALSALVWLSSTWAFRIVKKKTGADVDESMQNAQTMLNLVNQARSKSGIGKLTLDSQLTRAAQRHAKDWNMGDDGHAGSDGSTIESRIRATGYRPSAFAENMYWAQGTNQPNSQQAFNWWMNSGEHKPNIMNRRFQHLGFATQGFTKSSGKHYYSVQEFGAKR